MGKGTENKLFLYLCIEDKVLQTSPVGHKQKTINMIKYAKTSLLLAGVFILSLTEGQAQTKRYETRTPASEQGEQELRVLKRKVAIARFSNETQYGKGIFYNRDNDPMAKQAYDILSTKLQASGKFLLIEQKDEELKALQAGSGNAIAADYVILGSITEFGRKTIGKERLFGSDKSQVVEAGVSLRLVEVSTGLVIHSEEGKGIAETTARSNFGLGSKAGYDETLSDKAISGAIDKLVGNLINKCTDKPWRTFFLSADADALIIAGGASQGLAVGDTFEVYTRGKKVKNPQTGIEFELPGKRIAGIRIESLAGDTPETEYAIVTLTDGTIDFDKASEYYILDNHKK